VDTKPLRRERAFSAGELAFTLFGFAVLAFGVGAGIEVAGLARELVIVAVVVIVPVFVLVLLRGRAGAGPGPAPWSPAEADRGEAEPDVLDGQAVLEDPALRAGRPTFDRPWIRDPVPDRAPIEDRPFADRAGIEDRDPIPDRARVEDRSVADRAGIEGWSFADRAGIVDRSFAERGGIQDRGLIPDRAPIEDRVEERALHREGALEARPPGVAYVLGVAGGAALALTLGGVLFLALPSDYTALTVLLVGVLTWTTVVLLSFRSQSRR
jgi:hypothetical protein